jgi:glycosyltransferase involved in cell wall biosynthesis
VVTDLLTEPVSESTGTASHPLRLAYVLSRFPQISETFILQEMAGLEARGHQVRVVAMALDGGSVRQPGADHFVDRMIRPRGLEVVAAQLYWLVRRPGRYGRMWRDALWGNRRSTKFLSRAFIALPVAALAARRFESEPVDRVHAHYASHSLLCAWAINRLTDIPYGVSAHAHDLYVDRSMLTEKLTGASIVVTVSDFNKRLITGVCGPAIGERTEVIHCGVDTNEILPGAGPTTTKRPYRFAVVGSLQPYKGHRYLLEAFARVHQSHPDTELVLVGDGELRPSLEALATDLGISERTYFVGRCTTPQVVAELRAAHCVVQPSVVTDTGKMEGIPVALMEALACARPVIASDLSGISELVVDGETGTLVPPADVAALAAAMAAAMAEPESHALMAKRGRELVEAKFDLAGQIDRLTDLFIAHTPTNCVPERTFP